MVKSNSWAKDNNSLDGIFCRINNPVPFNSLPSLLLLLLLFPPFFLFLVSSSFAILISLSSHRYHFLFFFFLLLRHSSNQQVNQSTPHERTHHAQETHSSIPFLHPPPYPTTTTPSMHACTYIPPISLSWKQL